MLFSVILSSVFILVRTEARVVPAAVSPKDAPKSVDQLLNELKVLEKDREKALKNALENPDFKADSRMVEFLSVLSLVDSQFIEYHKYYDAMNTLIHSNEKSTTAHEALATIKQCRERSIKLNKIIKTKGEKLQAPSTGMGSQATLLEALFENAIEKNEEIEARLRIAFDNSPFSKYMKNMPQMPDIDETL